MHKTTHKDPAQIDACEQRYVSCNGQDYVMGLAMCADNYAWDPDYMGSSMMVPVVYVTWFMVVVFASLMS